VSVLHKIEPADVDAYRDRLHLAGWSLSEHGASFWTVEASRGEVLILATAPT
jgi:hypothetical protein